MKILYYSPHPLLNMGAPSGYATHIREIINGFKALGHTVKPVIMGGEKWTKKKTTDASPSKVKTIIKPVVPELIWQTIKDINLLRFDAYARKKLEQEVQCFKPDLIYERGFYLMRSGSSIAEKHQIPHYVELNAPYSEEKVIMEGKSLLINKNHTITKGILQKASKIIVVSSALQSYYSSTYQVPREKIIVTPNAININLLKKVSEKEINKIKSMYKIDESDFIIGFVGSIFPYHGVDILINAFNKLKHLPNIKLLIVGDGEILQKLKNQVAHYQLKEKVIFTGNVEPEQVFNYISLFDIAVMPKSNWYGSPIKIFEYAAMNKPVIAPNTIPVKDVMQNNVDGLLVNPNEEELIKAIEKLYYDKNFSKSISNHFHQKVLNKYTWQKIAEKILTS